MMNLSRIARRCFACLATLAATTASFAVQLDAVRAEDDTASAVVRIEEDWQLVVKSPDQNSAGPQVTCTISPVGHTDSLHATFELNHQSHPDPIPGGTQLLAWDKQQTVGSATSAHRTLLHHDEETIRWTQTMSLSDGALTFEVINGQSSSWNAFGAEGQLKTSIPTELNSLDNYSPFESARHSGVSYGANLVSSLVLQRVRLFNAEGDVVEYSDSISAHPSP